VTPKALERAGGSVASRTSAFFGIASHRQANDSSRACPCFAIPPSPARSASLRSAPLPEGERIGARSEPERES